MHVILHKPLLGYQIGHIFLRVSGRGYYDHNQSGDYTFHTDGKCIGPIEVTMKKSTLTRDCITEEGFNRFRDYLNVLLE